MKKVLTLFLAVCMLISIIPMAVSAETIIEPEAPKAPENITTVYVSNTGNDSTEDGTNKNTPYLTFNAAYNAAVTITGTGDRKIVVLTDVKAFSSTDKLVEDEAAHYLLKDYDDGTIYVCSESDNAENVPYIDFEYKTNTTYWTCAITLGADTVFYNIGFDCTGSATNTSTKKNIWICAALHDLTLGTNIMKKCGTLAVNGTVFANLKKSDSSTELTEITAQMDAESSEKTTISIYSGTYGGVYAGNRSNSSRCNYAPVSDITLNLFGGSYSGNISAFNGGTGKNVTVTKKLTISVYDIELTSNKKIWNENASAKDYAYLNLYNSNLVSQVDDTNFNEINKCYAIYVGVQNTTVNTNTTDDIPDNTYSVRFVGVIDSLDYEAVGFEISTTTNDRITGGTCEKLYTSVVGDGDDYTASELGGNYIFAYAIKDIPTSVGTVTFTVKPYYVVKVNEVPTTYYGTAYTVTYNAEGYVSSAVAN